MSLALRATDAFAAHQLHEQPSRLHSVRVVRQHRHSTSVSAVSADLTRCWPCRGWLEHFGEAETPRSCCGKPKASYIVFEAQY